MKYILNLTKTTLSIGKYLDIPAGKYAQVSDAEAESTEALYAVRAKWATVHDQPPVEIEVEKPTIVFESQADRGVTSLAELEKPAVLAEPEAEESEPKTVRSRRTK